MKRKIDWFATGFLTLTPILAFILWSWHSQKYGISIENLVSFAFFSICCGLSITAGYHRLYAHQTYRAKSWVHFILLFFGSASFQGTILKWATEHRRHHRKLDTDDDPYTIKKGFFYAHLGWLFLEEEPAYKEKFEPDLQNNSMIWWQHKNYRWFAFLCGFGGPALMGLLYGDPLGGFIYGGLVRTVFNHHSTFLVNSLAHTLGKKNYSLSISARDSWIVAILTYGEGYHNFHHTFEGDYRNGIKWYHFDPTKWILWITAKFGGISHLQSTSLPTIFKAKIRTQRVDLEKLGVTCETFQPALERLEEALAKWRELSVEYKKMCLNFNDQSREQIKKIKFEMNLARTVFLKRYYFWLGQFQNLRASFNVGPQRA